MARIGFIGLGNMGLPMALNLRKAGHSVTGFDVSAAAIEKLVAAGGAAADGVKAAAAAHQKGLAMLDAPVSGGVAGAQAATLTFMVGGTEQAFARAKPLLEAMGKTIIHAGPSGNGQAAKICNNMMLGISMIAVSEAFVLAERLGLDAQKLFDISSKSSGQCSL